jgi:hypothetical protein
MANKTSKSKYKASLRRLLRACNPNKFSCKAGNYGAGGSQRRFVRQSLKAFED